MGIGAPVSSRFTRSNPCPICGGSDDDRRGQGTRCFGFLSGDGQWAHCSREEHAGECKYHDGSRTWAHKIGGKCRCGSEHAPAAPGDAKPAGKGGSGRVVKAYDYRDEDGEIQFQVARTAGKKFFQRRPDGKGGWINNLKGVELLPYRLDLVSKAELAEPIFVPEGEKDVDRLILGGLVATCNPMGAGKWRDDYTEFLRHGLKFVLLPDNDEVGRDHMRGVARSVARIAAEVRILDLADHWPDMPEKADVSDWLDRGHTTAELRRLAADAPIWQPPAETNGHPSNGTGGGNGQAGRSEHRNGRAHPPLLRLKTISVRDIKVQPVEYLSEPHLPIGMLINLAGDGGQGKSLLTLSILADLSRNRPPLGIQGTIDGAIDALLCAAEDGQADTVKPRLLAAGADIDRIEVIEGVKDEDGKIIPFDITYIPLVRQHIEAWRSNGKNFRVLVIDPITTYIGRAKIDDHRDAQLKPALELLSRLAQEMGITVICCIHLNKAGGSGNAIHRIMGGAAYVNSSRLTYVYGPHPDDESKRVLTAPKANLPTRPWSITVRVEAIGEDEGLTLLEGHADHLDEAKKAKLAGQLRRLIFEGKSDLTASDVLDPGKKPKTPADHIAKATAWLADRLKAEPAGTTLVAMQGNSHIAKPWPAPGTENRDRIVMGQIKWWRETILKGQLGGSSRKLGMAGPWFFTLTHHEWPPSDQAIRAALDAEREGDEAEERRVF